MELDECPYGRQSGRTAWMLTHLVNAVLEGQPHSVVLSITNLHRKFLMTMFARMCHRNGIPARLGRNNCYDVEGSNVTFLTLSEFTEAYARSGYRNAGIFEDHFTAGEQ